MKLSERIVRMAPSATTAMAAKAKELKDQGRPVVSFTTGEPDFNSPKAARDYAVRAMDEGQTHYTVNAGMKELRQAAADYYERHFGLRYGVNEVITGTGAKQLLYEAMGCLVNPGDEVILFAPAWVSYFEQVRLFDGVPVIQDTQATGCIPDPQQFEKLITDKTVAVVLNNPNNPTGMVYPHDVLEKITRIALKHGITLINDEIYERLVYGVSFTPHLLQLVPEARDFVLNINGVSKSFAMTGWRLGYALGPEKLIKAMTSMQGHITSNTSSISQWAAMGALKESEEDVERMRKVFEQRRALVLRLLADIPGLSVLEPSGAFYVFMDLSAFLGEGKKWATDVDFCEAILKEKALGLVPGTAFLSPGHVRLSYSCSEEQIVEGVRRLKEFLA
ncbi:MAG: pyridoxal phosphate-dependent aminotransferase [Fretibacterium sp.]|nr:pyridoxal phosphate-dependent aminotransferase [Fretibacterium sp.]